MCRFSRHSDSSTSITSSQAQLGCQRIHARGAGLGFASEGEYTPMIWCAFGASQTIQNQLIDIVEAVIGTRVQPDEYMESFFDSMSKVQLMVEVKDRLGVTLPVDEIDALVDSVQVLADYVAEHGPR